MGKKRSRTRALVPRVVFRLIVRLVSGKNFEGYFHVLDEVFEALPRNPVTPSALSQMRKRVSYRFFRDAFTGTARQAQALARTFRGKRIYAMDGFELHLPRTTDVLKQGFEGRWVSQHRQQYYPTMYTVFCVDVLSETLQDVRFSTHSSERRMAEEMVADLEPGSLCLYDRGFPGMPMIEAHAKAGNHFLFRLPVNSFKQAQRLLELQIQRRKAVIAGVVVYFIKAKNPKTGETSLFITDLPRTWADTHLIRSLYNLRWECETGFSELVRTLQIEQWHSKFMNGILQEFFATLWLYNFTKLQILKSGQIAKNPLEWEYDKPNFKFILDWVIRKLNRIFLRSLDPAAVIQRLIIRTTARRKRHSRSKPRVLKYSLKRYPFDNTLWQLGGQT